MYYHSTAVADVRETDKVRAFKFEMNGMAFMSVINGIYQDKPRAPVRELSTNAFDAHIDAGIRETPFDVHIPTVDEPFFMIRDYGNGIADDVIEEVYGTMFSSTKRDNDDAVGMIGLGSKSPFAVTNSFLTISRHMGIRTVYNCFIGEGGVPRLMTVAQDRSDEPSGLEISFNVDKEAVGDFQRSAQFTYQGFDPLPRFVGAKPFKLERRIAWQQGTGWELLNPLFGIRSLMAKQGCVLYPIDAAALGITDMASGMGFLTTLPGIVDFDIGDLSVSTSREGLGYDEKTVGNVRTKLASILAQMTEQYAGSILAAPNYLDACIRLQTLVTGGNTATLTRALAAGLEYRGRTLGRSITFNKNDLPDGVQMRIFAGADQIGHVRAGVTLNSQQARHTYDVTNLRAERFRVYTALGNTQQFEAKARRLLAEGSADTIIMIVRGSTQGVLDEALETLGVTGLSIDTVTPLLYNRVTRDADTYQFRVMTAAVINGHTMRFNRRLPSMLPLERVVPDNTMFYVDCTGSDYRLLPNVTRTFSNAIDWLREVNAHVPLGDYKIYLVNSINQGAVTAGNMRPFVEFFREKLQERIEATGMLRRRLANCDSLITLRGMMLPYRDNLPADLQEALDQTGVQVVDTNTRLRLERYATDAGCPIQQGDIPTYNGHQILEQYPILRLLANQYRAWQTDGGMRSYFNEYMRLLSK